MSDQKRKWLHAMCDEQRKKRKRIRGKQPEPPGEAVFTRVAPPKVQVVPPPSNQRRIEDMPATVKTKRVTVGMLPHEVPPAPRMTQTRIRRTLRLINLGT